LFLLEERRLAIGTVVAQISALRFFCRHVLQRRDVREDLPYPKAATSLTGRAVRRDGQQARRPTPSSMAWEVPRATRRPWPIVRGPVKNAEQARKSCIVARTPARLPPTVGRRTIPYAAVAKRPSRRGRAAGH
jgi:hypothetical protein